MQYFGYFSTDVTLHVAIIVMLIAFVLGGWYLYERQW
jgi:hypothetical protein